MELNSIIHGDCLEVMKEIPDNSIDAVITDPPYALGFMGKEWDTFGTDLQNYQEWTGQWARHALRVLKPCGYLLSFGGTRTYHRMVCGIEDAGFEIRDCIMWVYGSGFPKSLNIAKSIDRLIREGAASLNRIGDNSKDIAKRWSGWGTALKPAVEPIVVARKPLSEKNVALNVLKWGTGGLNIDECRIAYPHGKPESGWSKSGANGSKGYLGTNTFKIRKMSPEEIQQRAVKGRFPANLLLECVCDEVIEGSHTNPECPCYMLDKQSGISKSIRSKRGIQSKRYTVGIEWARATEETNTVRGHNDSGGASRFFYCAKASRSERDMGLERNVPFNRSGNPTFNYHPTIKPISLMEYLVKLVTPPNGIVLDPFAGSGSTLIACKKLGVRFIGIEKEEGYVEIAKKRLYCAYNTIRQGELFDNL